MGTNCLLQACIAIWIVSFVGAGSISEYQEDEEYQADYYNDSEYYQYDDSREFNGKENILKRTPKFSTMPSNIIVNKGSTIKLACELDKLDGFMLMWMRKETVLAIEDRVISKDPRIQVESRPNGNTLIISLAENPDEGEYTCQVNSISTTKLIHKVQIRDAPVVKVAKSLVVVKAGEPVLLECEIKQGNPEPLIYWTRKDQPFPSGEQKLLGDSVVFLRPSRHDSGLYTCHGDNGWGVPANSSVQLIVEHAPVIEQEETLIHTREGERLQVTCIVHANPPATVEWYRNGHLLDLYSNHIAVQGNRYTLHINNNSTGSSKSHASSNSSLHKPTLGKYECRAMNKLGEDMRLTEVTGLAEPARFQLPASNNKPSNQLNISWSVRSFTEVTEFKVNLYDLLPELEVIVSEIVQPSRFLPPDTYFGQLQLDNLTLGGQYKLEVTANNAYGWSKVTEDGSLHFSNGKIVINLPMPPREGGGKNLKVDDPKPMPESDRRRPIEENEEGGRGPNSSKVTAAAATANTSAGEALRSSSTLCMLPIALLVLLNINNGHD